MADLSNLNYTNYFGMPNQASSCFGGSDSSAVSAPVFNFASSGSQKASSSQDISKINDVSSYVHNFFNSGSGGIGGDDDVMSIFASAPSLNKAFFNMQGGCGMYVVDHEKLESQYSPVIEKYAAKYGIRADVAKAICRQESAFNPNARSRAGAIGLFQLMPGTAKDMKVQNIYDPEQNIEGGIKYLSILVKRYNGDYRKAVAAYNGGIGNVERKGIDFCSETSNYHRKILG